MTLFFQAVGVVLVAVILGLCLDRQGKDMGLLLTMAVTVMILTAGVSCVRPVVTFLEQLTALGELDSDIVETIFKIVGIGLLTEITSLICADGGRGSLGKALQILSGGVILWLSMPVFSLLLNLIQEILGGL